MALHTERLCIALRAMHAAEPPEPAPPPPQTPPPVNVTAAAPPAPVTPVAASNGAPSAPVAPPAVMGGVAALGPAWTRGEIERPQGEKDMGSWTAAVYTPEQQARLGVDEQGNKAAAALKKVTPSLRGAKKDQAQDIEALRAVLPGVLPVILCRSTRDSGRAMM